MKNEYVPDLEFEFEHEYDHYDFISYEQEANNQGYFEYYMEVLKQDIWEEKQREKMGFDEYEDLLLQIENWNGEVLDV